MPNDIDPTLLCITAVLVRRLSRNIHGRVPVPSAVVAEAECSTRASISQYSLTVYYGYCGIPWHSDREAVSSTLVDVVTRASGYPGARECFHGVKMTRCCNTRRLMANTDTDKPQSMQEPRRRLLPRDDQDSYDAMTIRRDPHERASHSSSRQRILGT